MIDNNKSYVLIQMSKSNKDKKKIKIKTNNLNLELDEIDIVYFDENTYQKANESIEKQNKINKERGK